MERQELKNLLDQLVDGETTVEQVLDRLKTFPYQSLNGFANLDHQRSLRTGFPEVIYTQGKTPQQVLEIFLNLMDNSPQVLATRVSNEMYQQICDRLPDAIYHSTARTLFVDKNPTREKLPGILVVSAGTSDIPVAEEAAITAELAGNQVARLFDVGVAGLHRLLDRLPVLLKAHVIIVVAGMEGALPSVVGGLVSAPIIAVPTSIGYGASFHGLAALLGMLNSCANGVAVVNIDNGYGAGCLAARINHIRSSK